jgi:hypothetical protein
MNKLSSYKSKAPAFNRIGLGDQAVRIASVHETDSFHQYDGTLKANLPAYSNPCSQVVLTVVALDGSGALSHRLQFEGFDKFSELTTEQVQSGNYVDVDEYVCMIDPKTGLLVRCISDERTAICEGIIDQLFAALGLPVGSGFDAIEEAIALKTPMIVTVVNDKYDGKDQYRIAKFKKYVAAVVESTSDIDA